MSRVKHWILIAISTLLGVLIVNLFGHVMYFMARLLMEFLVALGIFILLLFVFRRKRPL